LNEQRPDLSFSTCWTPQMPTIGQFGLTGEVLRKHLVPRRQKSAPVGNAHRYPLGVLRATDLVTCNILGYHLSIGVPIEAGRSASVSYGRYAAHRCFDGDPQPRWLSYRDLSSMETNDVAACARAVSSSGRRCDEPDE